MATQIRNRKARRTADCCSCLSDLLDPRLFKALGDPARIALLCELTECRRPRTVNDVAACCPTHVSVVSRHLALLRDAGVLSAERRGREVYYTVDCNAVADRLRQLADAIDVCCPRETPPKRKPRKLARRKEKPR
jgi:DNA-binding transcriptional ArsR family regulator